VLAAVILAAGGSSRMGQPKQLLQFRGTSLLRRAIDTALAVPAEQVIVVLGHAADQLLPEVEATSFVSPRAIPQLADADGIVKLHPSTRYAPRRERSSERS